MTDKNVRLGIIGLGAQGGMYARVISEGKVAGMTLGAITDTDPAKRELAAETYPGVPVFEDYETMLDSGDVVAEGPAGQQRGAAAAQRVEDRVRRVPARGGQRQVEQQARELLIGLARVALDRHEVVVEEVRAPQLDRLEQRAGLGEQRQGRRRTPERREVEGTHQGEVVDAGDGRRLHGHPRAEGGHLGGEQPRRLVGVHPVGRRRQQQEVAVRHGR